MYYIHVLHTAPYSCQPDRLATLRFSASSVVWDSWDSGHCSLSICDYRLSWTNSVSEAKIQITLLILRRGALSNYDMLYCQTSSKGVIISWLVIRTIVCPKGVFFFWIAVGLRLSDVGRRPVKAGPERSWRATLYCWEGVEELLEESQVLDTRRRNSSGLQHTFHILLCRYWVFLNDSSIFSINYGGFRS